MDETRVISFPDLAETADPEEEAARSGARRLLERAIDNLPGEFRVVFTLREIEGCSVEETAEQLDLNPQTVRTRIFRARRLLRAELEKTISSGMNGVFPFLGPRCARVTESVLARLAL
ncbi:MAG TPA: sigma-70 family RNA polymerase sigma factor [Rhizomicrobium sp.]|nr:sigma-70 family RNA polymerase sigma factor [Rhizomicrobium sp.]